jgi:hemerythrin-like domain-containing protein
VTTRSSGLRAIVLSRLPFYLGGEQPQGNPMAQEDACTLLDMDHVKVEQLFENYASTPDEGTRRALAQQICQELKVHIEIEDEIFYPAFRQATQDDKLVDQSNHEHQEALDLIARLEPQQRPDDATMKKLEAVIRDHVKDERTKMFPEARKAGNMDLMGLADRLRARKSELMSGHPA